MLAVSIKLLSASDRARVWDECPQQGQGTYNDTKPFLIVSKSLNILVLSSHKRTYRVSRYQTSQPFLYKMSVKKFEK